MGLCVNPVGVAFNPHGKSFVVRCRDPKHCPTCAEYLRYKLIDKVSRLFTPIANSGREIGFVTLTVEHDYTIEKIKKVNKEFSGYWQKFRSIFWKRGLKFSYFKMIEPSKEGVKHIHLLTSPALDYFDVQEAWAFATKGSLIVDTQVVNDIHNAGGYITKYINKLTDLSLFGKNEKIYSFSRDLTEEKDYDKYEYYKKPVYEYKRFNLQGKETDNLYVCIKKRVQKIKKDGTPQLVTRKRLRERWTVFIGEITYDEYNKKKNIIEKSYNSVKNWFSLPGKRKYLKEIFNIDDRIKNKKIKEYKEDNRFKIIEPDIHVPSVHGILTYDLIWDLMAK